LSQTPTLGLVASLLQDAGAIALVGRRHDDGRDDNRQWFGGQR
jgi:hypothetical protein